MPQSPSTATLPSDAAAPAAVVTRAGLLRALCAALALVAVVGVGMGALLFSGSELLPQSALPFFMIGIGAACFSAIFTVFLHGRFAATPAPGADADPARTSVLVTGRLQSLLASAFGVKLLTLVVAVLALKQFPLGEEPTKFSDIATFAVTFAGASLLCQLATAGVLARTLRRTN